MRHFVYVVLPVGAVFALASGPSSAAAYAECRARVAQEQKDKQKSPTRDQGEKDRAEAPRPSDDDQGKRPERRSSEAAFVASEVAKPASSETWQFGSAADHRPARQLASPRFAGIVTTPMNDLIAGLHRPAYLAQAPPVS